MIFIKTFEKFAKYFPKDKWVELSEVDRGNLKKEIWELVDNAYKSIGGHVRIINPNSVIDDKELSFWKAINIDNEPDPDAVIFARKNFGYKISGWGHDGSKDSKKKLLEQLKDILREKGFWIEVSCKPSEILIASGINFIKDINTIQRIFPESKINMKGSGYYTRTLEDGTITDENVIVGNPIIK